MWLEAIHPSEDHEAPCPTCGGAVQRRVYGEMHAGSFVLNGERVEIRRKPDEGFIGPIVLDPLTQYFDGGLYRMWPSEKYLSRGGRRLHREVWKTAFGPIPKGCHIHHRDGDTFNNQLENLECMDASEHLAESRAKRTEGDGWFSDSARERAADWHRSEEGRLWHRQHAQRAKSWTKWKREPKDCPQCGVRFDALVRKSGASQIYCSSVCKAAAYRGRVSPR